MESKQEDIKNSPFYKKGLCGLTNLGNTCFMNTIVQCLNSNRDFATIFLTDAYKSNINSDKIDHNIVEQWALLCKGLYKRNCVVTPTSFHKVVQIIALKKGRDVFVGYGQNDSQEFLQYFLETLHNGLAKEVIMTINGDPENDLDKMAVEALTNWKGFFKNDYSVIVEMFYGQLHSQITTIDDPDYKSTTYDPFSNLSLEIPDGDNINIYDCLDHFNKREELEGHRQNEEDEKTYTKQMSFWSTPTYLIIFFKRYNSMGQKISKVIDFPIKNLNLSKYCVGYDKDNSRYDLHAVANHAGGLGGGHYWAYTKNLDGNWYKYNDKFVSLKKESELVTSEVYCLFYKKKD